MGREHCVQWWPWALYLEVVLASWHLHPFPYCHLPVCTRSPDYPDYALPLYWVSFSLPVHANGSLWCCSVIRLTSVAPIPSVLPWVSIALVRDVYHQSRSARQRAIFMYMFCTCADMPLLPLFPLMMLVSALHCTELVTIAINKSSFCIFAPP